MDRNLKNLLNSLKCPICQSQIDGTVTFHCAESLNHYLLRIKDLKIVEEIVTVCTEDYRIQIQQTANTKITFIHNLGIKEIKVINLNYAAFDFQNLNSEQIVSKINLLVTFA
jgi:hypothetical protein